MASFSLHGSHERSISLPTARSTQQSDERLIQKKLKNVDEIRHGISILTGIYKDIDEILGAPMTQRAFTRHRHHKWVEGWLEESVTHLDICSATREAILLMKPSLGEIRSTLRRPTLDQGDLVSCVYQLKEVKRETNKSVVSTLKLIESSSKNWAPPAQFFEVASLLRGASEATSSIFRWTLLCLQPKARRWSLVNKVMGMNKRGDEMKSWDMGEVDCVISRCLIAIQGLIKRNDDRDRRGVVESVCESLIGLERKMEGVEKDMESLFRCLIHTRVSFLNVLSQ